MEHQVNPQDQIEEIVRILLSIVETDCHNLFEIVESQQVLLKTQDDPETIKACLRDLHVEVCMLAHNLHEKIDDAVQVASI